MKERAEKLVVTMKQINQEEVPALVQEMETVWTPSFEGSVLCAVLSSRR